MIVMYGKDDRDIHNDYTAVAVVRRDKVSFIFIESIAIGYHAVLKRLIDVATAAEDDDDDVDNNDDDDNEI